MSLPPDSFYDRVLADLQFAVQNFVPTSSFDHHFIDTFSAQLATSNWELQPGLAGPINSSLEQIAQYSRKRGFPVNLTEAPPLLLHIDHDYWFHTMLLLLQELTLLQRAHVPGCDPPELRVEQNDQHTSVVIYLQMNWVVPLRYFSLLGAEYLQAWIRVRSTQNTRFLLGFLLHLIAVWGIQLHVEPNMGTGLNVNRCRIRLSFVGTPLKSPPAQTLQEVLRQYADWLAQGFQVAQYFYRPDSERPPMPFLGRLGGIAYSFPKRPKILLFGGVAEKCGRSTVMQNLAWTLAQEHRVLCLDRTQRQPTEQPVPVASTVDADENLLVEFWQAQREAITERLDVIPHWPRDPRLLGYGVREIAKEYDYVLVDCPSLDSVAVQSVIAVADLLLLVGGLNLGERQPLQKYFIALHEQPVEEPTLPALQVPMRSLLLRSWHLSEEQHQQLQQSYRLLARQAPLLQTVMGWDAAYQAALARGQAILQTGQPSRTIADYQQLAQELKRVLLLNL